MPHSLNESTNALISDSCQIGIMLGSAIGDWILDIYGAFIVFVLFAIVFFFAAILAILLPVLEHTEK